MYPLESTPTDEQKHRLDDWLTELKIISRKYRILLDTEDDWVHLIDMESETTIGIGLTYLTAERGGRERITAYDCSGSILDGVWLVESPQGLQEQRALGTTVPHHPTKDTP